MIDPAKLAEPGSPEELLVDRLDLQRLPRHVAVIMDGNGRWAQARGLPRVEGHRAGVEAVRETVEAAGQLELRTLTLYAFSVENWKRPRFEVWTLMNLLQEYVRKELDKLVDHGVRLRVLGRWRELDAPVVQVLEQALEATRNGDGLHLDIALNYSGRTEIVDACRRLLAESRPEDAAQIDADALAAHLDSAGEPDPDLLIRTSGERRISNFLLWQLAYAELWFTDVLWPDFRRRHLYEALIEYQRRERRYGGLGGGGEAEGPGESTEPVAAAPPRSSLG